MIIKKNDDRNLLPTDVIGSSVARSKRWLVAIVRICHEKKTGERLTKMGRRPDRCDAERERPAFFPGD